MDLETHIPLPALAPFLLMLAAIAVMPLDLPRPRDRLADGFVNTLVTVRRTLTEHLGMSAPMSG